MFFWNSCFFNDPADAGNLISGSSAFSKASLNIWKFMVHVLLKPGLENFEHYVASVLDECNCAVVWTFLGIAFLWDWNENWSFPYFWAPKSLQMVTVVIKRHLLLERKAMTNLDSMLKSRHITLPTKVCLVKAMVFPIVMYGWES